MLDNYESKLMALLVELPTRQWRCDISDGSSFIDIEDCEAIEKQLRECIESLVRIGVGDLNGNCFYIFTMKVLYKIAEHPKMGFSDNQKEEMLDFVEKITCIVGSGVLEYPDSREYYRRVGNKIW